MRRCAYVTAGTLGFVPRGRTDRCGSGRIRIAAPYLVSDVLAHLLALLLHFAVLLLATLLGLLDGLEALALGLLVLLLGVAVLAVAAEPCANKEKRGPF